MKRISKKSMHRLLGILMSVVCMMGAGINAFATETGLNELRAGAAVHLDIEDEGEEKDNEIAEADEEVILKAGVAVSEDPDLKELRSKFIMSNVDNSVNVRTEPDEDAETVGKLYKDCGGEILEQSNGWTKIQSGSLEGWAKDEYLLFGKDAIRKREEVGSLRATIQTDGLRVRKEADEEADIYGVVKEDETLKALDQDEDWVSVQYDENTVGYVSADYVSVEFKVDTGKTTKEIADEERAEELKKLSKNQGAISTSVSDVAVLAALIQCEAGSQSYEGQLAVGAVVMNRVRSGGYPNSIMGVISAPGQFPPATNGKVAAVVARGASASCTQAAQAAVGGATNVGGAMHFGRAGARAGITIGGHTFW